MGLDINAWVLNQESLMPRWVKPPRTKAQKRRFALRMVSRFFFFFSLVKKFAPTHPRLRAQVPAPPRTVIAPVTFPYTRIPSVSTPFPWAVAKKGAMAFGEMILVAAEQFIEGWPTGLGGWFLREQLPGAPAPKVPRIRA